VEWNQKRKITPTFAHPHITEASYFS
jgi:hypothetical protein